MIGRVWLCCSDVVQGRERADLLSEMSYSGRERRTLHDADSVDDEAGQRRVHNHRVELYRLSQVHDARQHSTAATRS